MMSDVGLRVVGVNEDFAGARDDDVARLDGWIPREDDFGGLAMKISRGSRR